MMNYEYERLPNITTQIYRSTLLYKLLTSLLPTVTLRSKYYIESNMARKRAPYHRYLLENRPWMIREGFVFTLTRDTIDPAVMYK
jgi:hypothetical protein